MKKKIIVIGIVLVVLVVGFLIINSKIDLYINWKIYLPGIQRRTVVYDDFFRDGDEISVFKYHSKWKMRLIRDINHFNKISSEDIENIRANLTDFYNGLGSNQKGESGKAKYDKNVDINQLLNINNYYLIKRKNNNKSYIILVLDVVDRRLYTFITIRH